MWRDLLGVARETPHVSYNPPCTSTFCLKTSFLRMLSDMLQHLPRTPLLQLKLRFADNQAIHH